MTDTSLAPVLYVEDEENDVVLMRLAFKRAGVAHPLRIASDGKEALEYLSAVNRSADFIDRSPCLVLLDLNLPRVSGFEVLQRARQMLVFKELPIIIFSSSAELSDKERARELGATDYIVKPTSVGGFVNVANELKHRWLMMCER